MTNEQFLFGVLLICSMIQWQTSSLKKDISFIFDIIPIWATGALLIYYSISN